MKKRNFGDVSVERSKEKPTNRLNGDAMRQRKSEKYFEELGGQFNEWMSLYDVQQRIKMIKKIMPASSHAKSCLEVGCGTGAISEALSSIVGSLAVSDISEKLAKEVGERFGASWSRQDACGLLFSSEKFDIVVSSECIEHTPDPRCALTEMARVVKKGGVLVVTSPNKLWYPILRISVALKIRKFSGNEIWLYPWEAAQVLRSSGLCNVSIIGCHLFPWQIPFAKWILPLIDRLGSILYPFMINYGVSATKPD